MTNKLQMNKKYIAELTDEERDILQQVVIEAQGADWRMKIDAPTQD